MKYKFLSVFSIQEKSLFVALLLITSFFTFKGFELVLDENKILEIEGTVLKINSCNKQGVCKITLKDSIVFREQKALAFSPKVGDFGVYYLDLEKK